MKNEKKKTIEKKKFQFRDKQMVEPINDPKNNMNKIRQIN